MISNNFEADIQSKYFLLSLSSVKTWSYWSWGTASVASGFLSPVWGWQDACVCSMQYGPRSGWRTEDSGQSGMTLISTRQITTISLMVSNKLHSSVDILCEAVKDLSDSCEAWSSKCLCWIWVLLLRSYVRILISISKGDQERERDADELLGSSNKLALAPVPEDSLYLLKLSRSCQKPNVL